MRLLLMSVMMLTCSASAAACYRDYAPDTAGPLGFSGQVPRKITFETVKQNGTVVESGTLEIRQGKSTAVFYHLTGKPYKIVEEGKVAKNTISLTKKFIVVDTINKYTSTSLSSARKIDLLPINESTSVSYKIDQEYDASGKLIKTNAAELYPWLDAPTPYFIECAYTTGGSVTQVVSNDRMKLTYTVVLGPAGWPKSVTAHDERFGDIISTCVHTGRLVTCTSKDAEGGPILETVRYTLDASNRVVEMTRGAGNTSERHQWVYDRQGNWTTSTLITPSATQTINRVITY